MLKEFLESLKQFIHQDGDTKYINLDDLKKYNFNAEELNTIVAALKEFDIKIREVNYERIPGHKKIDKDFSLLDNYLRNSFLNSSMTLKKLKDNNMMIPAVRFENVLGLRLEEDDLKHAIEFIKDEINLPIVGISARKDNTIFDENVIYIGDLPSYAYFEEENSNQLSGRRIA